MKTIDDARPLFAEGKSVNAVSRALGVSYYVAGKLKAEYDAEQAPEEAEAEPTNTDAWDLPLQVPADRAKDIFAAFTLGEQMEAIRRVLQGRLDAILAVPESEAA